MWEEGDDLVLPWRDAQNLPGHINCSVELILIFCYYVLLVVRMSFWYDGG